MNPKVLLLLSFSPALLLAACSSAPPALSTTVIPADVDAYLRSQDAKVDGIIAGNEKTVVWAAARGEKTPLSLIYLHGYQGSPRDYSPVLERVGKALGANVFFTRLSGYGVRTEAIVNVTPNDWIRDTSEALAVGRQIGSRVIVVGSSMGGDLALWLAAQKQPDIGAFVLFSPAVQTKDSRADMLLWPWPLPNIILGLVVGRYNVMRVDPATYPTADLALFAERNPPRYRAVSTIKLMQVIRIVRALPLETVTAPSLWLYSNGDDAVDIPGLKKCFDRMGGAGKRLQLVADAHSHMLGGDMFQPETTDELVSDVLGFLKDNGMQGELPSSR